MSRRDVTSNEFNGGCFNTLLLSHFFLSIPILWIDSHIASIYIGYICYNTSYDYNFNFKVKWDTFIQYIYIYIYICTGPHPRTVVLHIVFDPKLYSHTVSFDLMIAKYCYFIPTNQ